MAAARKPDDAAPAVDEAAVPVAEPEASVAEEAPEAPVVEEFRPAVTVVFTGQAQSAVAGVGLCDPGVSYPVPAAVADAVCRGESPQFFRAESA